MLRNNGSKFAALQRKVCNLVDQVAGQQTSRSGRTFGQHLQDSQVAVNSRDDLQTHTTELFTDPAVGTESRDAQSSQQDQNDPYTPES